MFKGKPNENKMFAFGFPLNISSSRCAYWELCTSQYRLAEKLFCRAFLGGGGGGGERERRAILALRKNLVASATCQTRPRILKREVAHLDK